MMEESMFGKIVLRVIARQLNRNSRKVGQIEKAFCVLDKDGDGSITATDLLNAIKKYKLDGLNEDDAETLFEIVDRNGSGTLDLQEFMSAAIRHQEAFTYPNLWQAFHAFDKDKDGWVTLDEIEDMIRVYDGGLLSRVQLDDFVNDVRKELQFLPQAKMDFDEFV